MASMKLWLCDTNKFGVKILTDKVVNQPTKKQNWMWVRENNGKHFCILPNKLWMYK